MLPKVSFHFLFRFLCMTILGSCVLLYCDGGLDIGCVSIIDNVHYGINHQMNDVSPIAKLPC